jgi:hypothetical protein|tara:strand:+ start:217 stop:1668 length:1452 start_codon:yes stop_codon:yes gene_type:complete
MVLAIAPNKRELKHQREWQKRDRRNTRNSLDEVTLRYNLALRSHIDEVSDYVINPQEAKMWRDHWESVGEFYAAQNNSGALPLEQYVTSIFDKLRGPANRINDALGHAGSFIANGVKYLGRAAGKAVYSLPDPVKYGAGATGLAGLLLFTGACSGQPTTPTPTIESTRPSPTATATREPSKPTPETKPTITATQVSPESTATSIPPPTLTPVETSYSEFSGFPERFFEESSVPKAQVERVVSAQYLSLRKMHNGISPYNFCKVEYEPEFYGGTTPDGLLLGDFAFPGLNLGHHRWEVMAHEQGHNFFGGTSWFYYQMAAPHAFLQESLAVLSAFYTYHDILENQEAYGIEDNTIDSLVFDFTNGRAYQEEMFSEYINQGKNFDINEVLTSQALDFMMITYGERYGWDKFERLAKAFEGDLGEQFNFIDDGVASPIEQSTYIVAALSAAFDQDFRQDFMDLNFPINDKFFNEALPKIKQYIDPL